MTQAKPTIKAVEDLRAIGVVESAPGVYVVGVDVPYGDSSSRVVELRAFGGLSVEETAEVLEISPATVKRYWSFSRAWLARRMASQAAVGESKPPTILNSVLLPLPDGPMMLRYSLRKSPRSPR